MLGTTTEPVIVGSTSNSTHVNINRKEHLPAAGEKKSFKCLANLDTL